MLVVVVKLSCLKDKPLQGFIETTAHKQVIKWLRFLHVTFLESPMCFTKTSLHNHLTSTDKLTFLLQLRNKQNLAIKTTEQTCHKLYNIPMILDLEKLFEHLTKLGISFHQHLKTYKRNFKRRKQHTGPAAFAMNQSLQCFSPYVSAFSMSINTPPWTVFTFCLAEGSSNFLKISCVPSSGCEPENHFEENGFNPID